MAFCGNCGASITQGNEFCGSCGKHVSSATQPGGPSAASAQTSGSGNAEWTPASPLSAAAPVQRPDTVSWSAVPNQPAQNTGWSPANAQPAPAAAAPNLGQGWSGVAAAPASAAAPAIASSAGAGLTRNIAGALAYSLGIITGILFLVLEPYRRDPFVRFHAFQSIFYFVFALAFRIAWSIAISGLMSISGWVLVVSFPLRMIISLCLFGLWLYVMFQAYNDREFRIPVLGAIAKKQAQG